ncbi:MAG: hypothetical protein M0Z53_04365 [Thermaerobacter sp.]|nr:hypothetical protein [Thermaerobacter sp.]
MTEVIGIHPKTIRLREQDAEDLRYLVLLSGETAGAVIRTLLSLVAQTVRTETLRLRPDLAADPQWWGNGGASTWAEERRVWAAWLAARQRDAQGASALSGHPNQQDPR